MLAESFDIKIRERLGVGCFGDDEIRIINRIVRITDPGLEYEADPRYVDLTTQSLNLQNSKSVVTPGVKKPDPGMEAEKSAGDDDDGPKDILDLFCALTSDNSLISKKSVRSSNAIIYHDVVPYGRLYGWLPPSRAAISKGWKEVGPRACHFTRKSADVLKARLVRRATFQS